MKVRSSIRNKSAQTHEEMLTDEFLIVSDEFKGMKYALEVMHPEKKITYKIDYLFIIFENEMDLERWYFALLTVCTPRNGHVDWVHIRDKFNVVFRSLRV
jgi:hypothetical protein